MMEEIQNYTEDDLQQLSYRILQQIAKSLALPSNVKKMYLVQLIYAKNHRTQAEVEDIVQRVRYERQMLQCSNYSKRKPKRKMRVQGMEVSSTNACISPPMDLTKQAYSPEMVHPVLRYHPRSPVSPKNKSDRVLRSYNLKSYKRPNYSLINNPVVDLVRVSERVKSPKESERQISIVSHAGRLPRLNVTARSVVRKFLPTLNPCAFTGREREFASVTTQTKDQNKMVVLPSKRNRTLSGIHLPSPEIPLGTKYKFVQSIGFRRTDGKITKINALVQKRAPKLTYNLDHINIPNNETKYKKAEVTIQDIINSNIDAQTFTNPNVSECTVTGSNMADVDSTNSCQMPLSDVVPNEWLVNRSNEMNHVSVYYHKKIRAEQVRKKSVPPLLPTYSIRSSLPTYSTSLLAKTASFVSTTPSLPYNTNTGRQQAHTSTPTYAVSTSAYVPFLPAQTYTFPAHTNSLPVYKATHPTCTETLPTDTLSVTACTETLATNTLSFTACTASTPPKHTPLPTFTPPFASCSSPFPKYTAPLPAYMSPFLPFYPASLPTYSHPLPTDTASSIYTAHLPVYTAALPKYTAAIPRPATRLPDIHRSFSKFARDVTQPLYVQVSEESERILSYPSFRAGVLLEGIYNVTGSALTQPLLQIASSAITCCVYSTTTVPSAFQQDLAPTEPFLVPLFEPDSKLACPSVDDEVATICDISTIGEPDMTLRRYYQEALRSSNSSVDTLQSQDVVTIPEMVEDALEIISQDGDYMERIGMDVRMQCILCSWAGSKIILEFHIRKEHASQITQQSKDDWNITYKLGNLVNQEVWLSHVCERDNTLYILSAKYEDPDCLMCTLTTISSLPDTESKLGTITIYNKVSGEPHFWQGHIPELPSNMPYENSPNCLKIELSKLELLPNSANIKLHNRSLVLNSPSKVVVGQPELNDIHIIVFVKVENI